LVFFTSAKEDM